MEKLIEKLTPETIAKLASALSDLLGPEMTGIDFAIMNTLSNKVYDIGVDKGGMDFVSQYFDAVANAWHPQRPAGSLSRQKESGNVDLQEDSRTGTTS